MKHSLHLPMVLSQKRWMIGTDLMDDAAILATASSISERTREIEDLFEQV